MSDQTQASRPKEWSPEVPPSLTAAWREGGFTRYRWIRYWIKDPFFGGLEILMHYGMRLLPIDTCSNLGGLLGRKLGPRIRPDVDRRLKDNFRHFHPEWTSAEVDQATLRWWDNVGRYMSEFSVLDRLLAAGRITVQGEENLPDGVKGQALIGVPLHLGNWEALGPLLKANLQGFYAVYRPPRSRFKHFIARRARERYGAIMLPPGKAAGLPLMRTLVPGNLVSIFADDDSSGTVLAPFLGRTPHANGNLGYVVRLAQQRKAAVMPGWCVRTGGCHFTLHLAPPVALDPDGMRGDGLQANINRINAVLEPAVLAHLDQWYWLAGFKPEA